MNASHLATLFGTFPVSLYVTFVVVMGLIILSFTLFRTFRSEIPEKEVLCQDLLGKIVVGCVYINKFDTPT